MVNENESKLICPYCKSNVFSLSRKYNIHILILLEGIKYRTLSEKSKQFHCANCGIRVRMKELLVEPDESNT